MTREERLEEEYARQGLMVDFDVCDFINEIYDDFDRRTCENCRHSNQTSYALYCRKDVKNLTIGVAKCFGCNKFEKAEK